MTEYEYFQPFWTFRFKCRDCSAVLPVLCKQTDYPVWMLRNDGWIELENDMYLCDKCKRAVREATL